MRLAIAHRLLAALFLLATATITLATTTPIQPQHNPAPYFFIESFVEEGDSGTDRLPLKATHADIQLNGFIASVVLTQEYRNEGNTPINACYIFPGSTRAAVNGMTMTIGERRIVAKIKEKQQAKKIFTEAKKAGKSASLLSQKRPNVFSMDVANVMPGDVIKIALTYTEIITPEDGIYEFVLPGVVGPRYGGDAAQASGETQWIANPYLAKGKPDPVRYGIDVQVASPLPIGALKSPSHKIITDWQDEKNASLQLHDSKNAGNRDFILRYQLKGEKILTGLSRFESNGENYFLLVAQPPQKVLPEQVPPRDYFFVVDVSGSMHGFPLDTTKQLMSNLLGTLNPSDRFNILFFAGGSRLLSPQPLAATAENIARANAMMNNQSGGGGTDLYSAMKNALAMNSDENSSRNIVLVSDGYISAEQRVFSLIDQNLHRNNVFAFGIGSSVNRHLIEGVAKAGRSEAFVVTNRAEALSQAKRFFDYISAPALTNIQLTVKGLELYDIEPARVPDMLAQRAVMVLGKYRNAQANATIGLKGVSGQGEHQWSFALQNSEAADPTLPQLWARKRLERMYVIPEQDAKQQRENIVDIGLKYSLLTRHTSFVAVDEIVRNKTGSSQNIKQPLPLPKGVSNHAVGQPMPEPELYLLGLITLLLAIRIHRRKLCCTNVH
ncbi:VIT domain-containing protein [Porticoccus sp. W117]|uniref:VIT domain-containing protein n=1 Tax=Porticoccus sp. W117 TaxID=3054777 RepID=UPI0025947C27|nr:VIT domain-containing protein [Porticoccus sp. W117]MDM3871066.1 VIT domain-containing protein [Porticoccus sp. W117]